MAVAALCLSLYPSIAMSAPHALTPLKPLTIRAQYTFDFSGIIFGRMGVVATETATSYHAIADVTSAGIVRVFVKHESHTTVEGDGEDFTYDDAEYESRYRTRDKKKYVHMRFADGTVASEEVQPPDNRQKRPAVPEALKKGALDPLSFALRMRQGLHAALLNNESDVRYAVYDGRRLTSVHLKILGATQIPYRNQDIPVYEVQATRELTAGYSDSEREDVTENEPPLHMYFTRDAAFIPVALEVKLLLGTLRATLTHDCAPEEPCLLGLNP